MSFQSKYIKYKTKYINLLKEKKGGTLPVYHPPPVYPPEYYLGTTINTTPEYAFGTTIDKPSLYIDVYRFKIFNYPPTEMFDKPGEIKFNILRKTTIQPSTQGAEEMKEIRNGYVSTVKCVDSQDTGLQVYSVDYIKSEPCKNKYYTYYTQYLPKDDLHFSKYNEQQEQDLIKTIALTIRTLTQRVKSFIPVIDPNKLTNENGYILKIEITNKNKIIVFGDHHGSYHTFFRNMLRLHICGVINLNTFKVNENYIIIFLGDIVDRGNFSLEILSIMFKFIINNLNNFIINRGNHEEKHLSTEFGFKQEVAFKLTKKEGETVFNNILTLFSLCSTAIILINTNTGKKYWLCHGLFYTGAGKDETLNKFIELGNEETVLVLSNVNATGIRWTDPPGLDPTWGIGLEKETHTPQGNITENVAQPNIRFSVGTNELNLFFTKFDFIIRGHTDNESNAWLFRKTGKPSSSSHYFIQMNDWINNKNSTSNKLQPMPPPPAQNILFYDHIGAFNDYPLKKYNYNKFHVHRNNDGSLFKGEENITVNNNDQIDGPVQTITDLDHTDIYNLLTISTNTDRDRTLTSDSYIVMRFDDNMLPSVTNTIKNALEIDSWLKRDV